MQPERMFRVRKLACLQREQQVCPQRINLVLAQRTLPAQLVVLQEQALKHLAQPV